MALARVEVYPRGRPGAPPPEGRAYLVESRDPVPRDVLARVLANDVAQSCAFDEEGARAVLGGAPAVEVFPRPGVADPAGSAASELLGLLGVGARVAAGRVFPDRAAAAAHANPLVHRTAPLGPGRFAPAGFPEVGLAPGRDVEEFPLDPGPGGLGRVSRERRLALGPGDLGALVSFLRGLGRRAVTDVELEVVAQTWSEHCKHRIFAARIRYREDAPPGFRALGDREVDGLFATYVEGATEAARARGKGGMLVSVFRDNAGVVRLHEGVDVCFKVETHNSPSALDPYGGALTGILGVNRDVLGCGLGARPVANTDVFCLPLPGLCGEDPGRLPAGVAPPRRMLEGVHRGVEDGGNKSGVPTVNGAMLFHESYAGKPLVFVGTVGVLPPTVAGRPSAAKAARPGDLAYVAGGAVGIDGIHGATFSSMGLDREPPPTAVQIGDPYVQKKLSDFLLAARDRGLFESVTDNGAGGLASSVGEMARESGGAVLDLDRVPLKYPGLAPWEIVVSESQERMTFAVPPEKAPAFEGLARDMGVDAARVGRFDASGELAVRSGGRDAGRLPLGFLHGGAPRMELPARWDGPGEHPVPWRRPEPRDPPPPLEALRRLLASPDVASKEAWVRRYDHEVQGMTIGKPFHKGPAGAGPADAGVLWLAGHGGGEGDALAVACGLAPRLSEIDPWLMAAASVDECARNLLCGGGSLGRAALLDNFCWPDPVASPDNPEGERRLGQLVRAAAGLHDACVAYGLPLVSGKDSMKNDYRGASRAGEPLSFGVLPTLLVSGVAAADPRRVPPNFAGGPGELVLEIGPEGGASLAASAFSRLFRAPAPPPPPYDLDECRGVLGAVEELRDGGLLASLHDVSDGGFLTAVAEALFVHGPGARLDAPGGGGPAPADPLADLFGEGPARFVATVRPGDLRSVLGALGRARARVRGETDGSGVLALEGAGGAPVDGLRAAWRDGLAREAAP